jgi:hypothetical protein
MSRRIETKNEAGDPNGWLLPIWHVDSGLKVDQVYLTAVAPGKRKGPHLHMVRCGRFVCVKGNVRIVIRENGRYRHAYSGERSDFAEVYVAPGCAAAVYNDGTEEALVLNMPSPPWRADDQDDWPVEGWL